MNGGILPLVLICVTAGVVFAFASLRFAVWALVGMAATAIVFTFIPIMSSASDIIFAGLWLSVIATAALVFVQQRFADRLIIPVGLNAGGWAGAVAVVSDRRTELFVALFLLLLFIPVRWFTLRKHTIAIKVVASWMIAIASLSMFVSFMPTPGYKPDHME